MKSDGRNKIQTSLTSEWDENILFDFDDPDLRSANNASLQVLNTFMLKVPSNMSLADLQNPHLAELCNSIGRSSISMSSSLSDLVGSPLEITVKNCLSIDEAEFSLGSCFTCGVSWLDDHVSLDCSECGGYSRERPCPLCDGNCGVIWKRDFTMSHAFRKARWQGVCAAFPDFINNHFPASVVLNQATPQSCGAIQRLAQELCDKLEQLSVSAQT